MAKLSKRVRAFREKVDANQTYLSGRGHCAAERVWHGKV